MKPNSKNTITFCNTPKNKEEAHWLSTHYANPFVIYSHEYKTVEHFYQSQKFASTNSTIENEIIECESAQEAINIAEQHNDEVCEDFDVSKEIVMQKALRNKFHQNEELYEKLKETNTRNIINMDENDEFWGIGSKGIGKNRLAHIIMLIRAKMRNLTSVEDANCNNSHFTNNSNLNSQDAQNSKYKSDVASIDNLLSKKVLKKKRKNRSKRDMFRDADGCSKFQVTKASKSGSVHVVAGEELGNISLKALPTAARQVVNQQKKKDKNNDILIDLEENEDDYIYEDEDDLAQYMYKRETTAMNYNATSNNNNDNEYETLPTLNECLNGINSKLEFLSVLPNGDEAALNIKKEIYNLKQSLLAYANSPPEDVTLCCQMFEVLSKVECY